ncbi:sterile alpha motif domain-containing 3-like isoform X2 [Labeo rohita]|uniref:Sterile alpha motif domain-containing 3-like isoform X2 n=1 Tax=Labeo rohita TaxID=84645 RepID=A0A498LTA5_LABRO|nr:sterile alpha motif domain-containing 3-like isoform X2 [Labeo rohita]
MQDSADDHVFQDLDLGILLVEREGAVSLSSLHLNPASFKIVIEGEVVMKSIKDLPKAMWLLFGLTYALHLSYPKPMKNTFQFIQQDSDPKHTSRLCKGYLTKKESDGVLRQMTWPPQSPDLNPIEMVWDEMDRRMKAKGPTRLPQIKLYHGWKRKLRVGDAHDGMGMKRLVVAEVLSVMKMRPLVRILQVQLLLGRQSDCNVQLVSVKTLRLNK